VTRPGTAARAGRGLLLAALALSATVPLGLLAVWSVSGPWFYPALLPGAVTAESWRQLLGGDLATAAGRSVALGLGTAATGTAVGLPVGRALARLTGWRRRLGAALVFLPVAAPPVALAVGVQVFFLRLGLGGSALGVLLAHTVPAAGYLALYFLGVFAAYDPGPEEEARTLGATPRQAFWRVTLPALRRQVGEAAALGFLVSWAQVAFTQLVGGGLVRTLPTEVFSYVRSGQDRYAAAGALLLSLPPLLALAAARVAARRATVSAP
jgi:putative spermidine/putrescine transport system permease protein